MTGYCNCNGQYSASCDPTKEDQKECIKILPEDKRLMNNWRESKLIFRRFKKKEIEYVRKNKDGKVHCKEGFKKCTPIHCVKDYVQCPITHFWLNLGKKTYVKKGNDVEVIDLGKDSLVVERKSDSEKIVNGFHLELNGMPCYDTNSGHKLATKKGSILGYKLGDKRGCTKPWGDNLEDYKQVDHVPLLNFLGNNGMKQYVDHIPNNELSHLLEDKMYLSARFKLFMGLDDICQDFDLEKIKLFSLGVKSIILITKILTAATLIFALYFMMLSKRGFGLRLAVFGLIVGAIQLVDIGLKASANQISLGFVDDVTISFKKFKCLGHSKMSSGLFTVVNSVSEFLKLQEESAKYVLIACVVLIVIGGLCKLLTKEEVESWVEPVKMDEKKQK